MQSKEQMEIDEDPQFKEEDHEIVDENIDEIENEVQDIQFEKQMEATQKKKPELRRIPVPPHRVTPLKNSWEKILTTLVENMKLQIRMNTKRKCVELKTSNFTEDATAIQKGVDFLKAFMMGFEINDAVALLRLDDLYIESFQIKDGMN